MTHPVSTAGKWKSQNWNLGSLHLDRDGHMAFWTEAEIRRQKVRHGFHARTD